MSKEAMRLALEALESNHDEIVHDWSLVAKNNEAITTLREALAEQPASKPWVGLTDAERETLRSEADEADVGYRELIKATEAKLRKKNS